MEQTIKATTPSGKAIEIHLSGDHPRFIRADISVAGLKEHTPLSTHAGGIIYKMDKPQLGATHYLRTSDNKGVGLAADVATGINQVYDQFRAAVAALPANRLGQLREERERLTQQVRSLLDEQQYQRERWFESETKRGPMPEYDIVEVRAAQQAVRDFDAAHPEVIAEIKAQQKADTERHMWD